MLYRIIKIYAKAVLPLLCRRIVINNTASLQESGPLLIAANHPNSFLDSIIINTLFNKPVWSLARGDAFKGKKAGKILRSLKIMPVYRTSEGVENLSENYKTFEECIQLFKNNEIVTIYSEGLCENEWHLRPLKKGTARLVMQAWNKDIPLRILPTGINYSSFSSFGKNVFLHFGNIISLSDFSFTQESSDGAKHQQFNKKLSEELQKLIYEIPQTDRTQLQEKLTFKIPVWQKIILAIPAAIGALVHTPLYIPFKYFIKKKYGSTVHYDSVIGGALFLAYPFYLLLLLTISFLAGAGWWSLPILPLIPFTAWAFIRLKQQLS